MLQKFYEEEKIERLNKYTLYILLFMMCIIPIVTYKYVSNSYSPKFMNNFYATGEKTDVFNFFKTLVLYLGTAGIFGMFMYKVVVLKEEIKKSKLNVLLLIFLAGIMLSLFSSDYKDIALFGNFDRHEGALAWFCYITIFFVLYNIEIEEKYYKLFYFALIPFLVINTILGLLNLYEIDILQSKVIQFIIGGHGTVGGKLWTTLYNPNFSGGITGVIFAVSFTYLLLEKERNKRAVIFLGTVLSFIIMLTSLSVSGFIAIVGTLPLSIFIGLKFGSKKDTSIIASILLVLSGIIMFLLNKQNYRIYDETLGNIEKLNDIHPLIVPILIVLFIAFLILLKFVNKKKFFNILSVLSLCGVIALSGLYFYDLNKTNKELETKLKSEVTRIQDTDIFQKLDVMSSYRVSIWNEVGKLINEKPLFGYGFDTLPYVLDHTAQEGWYETITIDKPHNLALELVYGCGIVGLIGFIGVMWYLIKESYYKYVDNKDDKFTYITIVGVVAFLIQGILNDTFVGTSIVFWIFGGICANRLVLQESKKYQLHREENISL